MNWLFSGNPGDSFQPGQPKNLGPQEQPKAEEDSKGDSGLEVPGDVAAGRDRDHLPRLLHRLPGH